MDLLSELACRRSTLALPRGRRLSLGPRPAVQGILNVTPDSFSDGGLHTSAEHAVALALHMVEEGADVIDVGGESTRPGAAAVDALEQCRRVLPVIEGIRKECDVPISIDTRDPNVGQRALDAGADIVNDVSACADPGWISVLVGRPDVPVILMHMRGTPETMQTMTSYPEGVLSEVRDFLRERMRDLERAGVSRDRFVLDPGIGFAKDARQNLLLLRGLAALSELGRPVLVGASRKVFLGKLLERSGGGSARTRDPAERDVATVAANAVAVLAGASILRVHNVPFARDLADVIEGLVCAGEGAAPERAE